MHDPLVICLCPTYARAGVSAMIPTWDEESQSYLPKEQDQITLLEDVFASFYSQDYPGRMCLAVGNDCSDQYLIMPQFTHDIIKKSSNQMIMITNNMPRFSSSQGGLGSKFNLLLQITLQNLVSHYGSVNKRDILILPWEDDDISLPHRVSQAVDIFRTISNSVTIESPAIYFNPQYQFYFEAGSIKKPSSQGVCHNSSAFNYEAWERVNGYPQTTGDQDAAMDYALKSREDIRLAKPLSVDRPQDWSYIYRWGVSHNHLSGNGDPKASWDEYPSKVNPRMGDIFINPRKSLEERLPRLWRQCQQACQ